MGSHVNVVKRLFGAGFEEILRMQIDIIAARQQKRVEAQSEADVKSKSLRCGGLHGFQRSFQSRQHETQQSQGHKLNK